MKLTKIYEGIVNAFGIVLDDKRQLHWTCGAPANGDKSLIKINLREKKATLPIVMPDKKILRQDEDFKQVKFNPMAESFMAAAVPEVTQQLVVSAGTRVAVAMSGIMHALLEFSLNQEAHANASPALFELIKDVPTIKTDASATKTHKFITEVLKLHNGAVGTKALGRFKLEKAVEIDGKIFNYGCRYVPVFEKWIGKDKVLGVKRPNKDAGFVLDNIIRVVCKPLVAVSDTKTAPNLTVLLQAFADMAKHLNRLATLLKLDADPLAYINFEMPDMDEMYKLYIKELNIPFPGNVGILDPVIAAEESAAQEQATGDVEVAASAPVVAPKATEVTKTETAVVVETQEEKPPVTFDPADPYAWVRNNNANTATATPQQPAEPVNQAPRTMDLSPSAPTTVHVEPAPVTPSVNSHASTAPRIEKNPMNELVHLKDYTGRPLTNADGSPYLIDKSQQPKKAVMQKVNGMVPMFDQSTGAPLLMEAPTAQPGVPGYPQPAPGYPNAVPGYPQQPPANPNDPYAAYRAGKQMQAMAPAYGGGVNPYAAMMGQVPQQPGYAAPAPAYQQPSYNAMMVNQAPGYGQQPYGGYMQPNGYGQPVNTVNVAPGASYH